MEERMEEKKQEMNKVNFTHLHVHTGYSLLDGSAKIGELVKRAKELGMDSLAITDHGVMYGAVHFYKACKDAGIKPIIGCEVYVAPNSRFDREIGKEDDRYYHLVLLAKNNIGYKNLCKIVSKGFIDGFYYKPRVDKEVLREYSEGIIALSACIQGEVAVFLRKRMYDEAKKRALEYYDIFGEGNYYLEMQDHGIPDQTLVNTDLMRMSKETGIPLVVTNDSHYIKAEDWEAHDVLLCIQTNRKVQDQDRMRYEGGQYYLKSAEEMEKLFPYAKEALENTHIIAEQCNVEMVFGEKKLPKFEVPEGYDSYSYLRELCFEGLKNRYSSVTNELTDRLEYELGVIQSMGFVDYFLIVWDFIHYARSKGIIVGPGRGSGAGSIVAYCLKITSIDPIKYNLIFERFLNPERVTMPDIDVDFCDDRRQEVIDYVIDKYGKDKVTQIVTFGTMKARNCIRDVGRAMDIPYNICDSVAKAIPAKIPDEKYVTIDKAFDYSPDFKKMYDEDETVKRLVDMAKKLEGLPRHSSIHPAGVIIGREAIEEYVPLAKGGEDSVVSQYEAEWVEQLGLLKMDFLALKTLTVIRDAINSVKKSTGEIIDIDKIDFNEKGVYELISSGKCEGVFQLESGGMKGFMKELKPHNLEDIIAGISLYRPGPMDFIPQYIKGKESNGNVEYEHESLESILAPTYGCIVYQEQVMQIVMKLAGYTMGRSDLVRRAMSKKKADVMAKEREYFVYGNKELGVPGCINNGISEEIANKIFDEMTDFASYAFNKSHAAAYAVVAYETAYMKYHYPKEFMAALMTSVRDNSEKVSGYIQACKQMRIKLLPPDVNEGEGDFSVSGDSIRYGMSAIKSIGDNVVEAIVKEREEHGPYKDLSDIISRMSNKEANKRTIENFIYAGAFDSFGYNRRQMIMIYPQILEEENREKKNKMSGQLSLLDFMASEDKTEFSVKYPEVDEFSKEQILAKEKDVLGVYVSGHPLDEFRDIIEKNTTAKTIDFTPLDEDEEAETSVFDKVNYTVGGTVESVNVRLTKQGQNMAILTLEDLYGTMEIIVFPRQYEKYRQKLVANSKIMVNGQASINEKESKLLANDIISFDEIKNKAEAENKQIWVLFENIEEYKKNERAFVGNLRDFPGYSAVYVQLKEERKGVYTRVKAECCDNLINALKAQWGVDKVIIRELKNNQGGDTDNE